MEAMKNIIAKIRKALACEWRVTMYYYSRGGRVERVSFQSKKKAVEYAKAHIAEIGDCWEMDKYRGGRWVKSYRLQFFRRPKKNIVD